MANASCHASYQHPQRLREGTYNIDVARFPLLLVATALRALKAKGRELWDRYDNGDNMLFREGDLREPARSGLLRELLQPRDTAPMAAAIVRALAFPLLLLLLLSWTRLRRQQAKPVLLAGLVVFLAALDAVITIDAVCRLAHRLAHPRPLTPLRRGRLARHRGPAHAPR